MMDKERRDWVPQRPSAIKDENGVVTLHGVMPFPPTYRIPRGFRPSDSCAVTRVVEEDSNG
jgi:hypothetical protein